MSTPWRVSSTTHTRGSKRISTESALANDSVHMERSANYAAVGAFVLVVTLDETQKDNWYTDTREHRNFNRYEVYFEGTESGLERGSAVRYLGVGVGLVVHMSIDPRDS